MKQNPIKRQNIADIIINEIKEQVIQGDLKPGERLPTEQKLGEIFSVGRTSVREALKALSYMGIIQRSRGGTIISKELPYSVLIENINNQEVLKKVTIEELIEARVTLETKTAFLAAERCTDEDLEEMAKLLEKSAQSLRKNNWLEFTKYNIGFHKAIVEASNNCIFIVLFNSIEPFLHRLLITSLRPPQEKLDFVHQQHLTIYQALKDGEPHLAEKATREHMNVMYQHVNL